MVLAVAWCGVHDADVESLVQRYRLDVLALVPFQRDPVVVCDGLRPVPSWTVISLLFGPLLWAEELMRRLFGVEGVLDAQDVSLPGVVQDWPFDRYSKLPLHFAFSATGFLLTFFFSNAKAPISLFIFSRHFQETF